MNNNNATINMHGNVTLFMKEDSKMIGLATGTSTITGSACSGSLGTAGVSTAGVSTAGVSTAAVGSTSSEAQSTCDSFTKTPPQTETEKLAEEVQNNYEATFKVNANGKVSMTPDTANISTTAGTDSTSISSIGADSHELKDVDPYYIRKIPQAILDLFKKDIIDPEDLKSGKTDDDLIEDSYIDTLSYKVTGSYSAVLESYLLNLENRNGTMYMFNEVFNKDKTIYDPYERASELTEIPLDINGMPVNCGEAGIKLFNEVLYGRIGKTSESDKNLEELGIDLSKIRFSTTSTINKAELTNAKSYTVVSDDSTVAGQYGYITQSDFERMIYVMVHECGTTENSNTEMFGTASVLLNLFEHEGFYDYGTFNKDTMSDFLDGFYSFNKTHGLEIENDGTKSEDASSRARKILDYVLSGKRAFCSEMCYWIGNTKTAGFSNYEGGTVIC